MSKSQKVVERMSFKLIGVKLNLEKLGKDPGNLSYSRRKYLKKIVFLGPADYSA